ncbi:pectate lyase superfamily protein [Pleomorphomonas sp. SM30]|uniref:Putative secreted repeat protein (TIGR03808 family) n=2 Tax=Oharaeibacter diazotrophicus TaxID=1920512 RepID=A0A4R6RJ31_9HYPH|nr:TIGR03808 family TAT-translocated repetitive protein [Oharaeibacter diazotrophicus]TDP86402.1 putative secreted repeat protein (TIGR03808 family) [Oharaeibacter diazotrophicus]BBE71655.1 pectate lyase superfamily protein [Pleomorphomonas sp. SM30]
MDRRAFLYGTVASIGTALMFTPARSDSTARIELADLRGSLAGGDAAYAPSGNGDQSAMMQQAMDRAAAAGKPLYLPPGRYELSNVVLPSRLKLVGVPGESRLVYTGGGTLLTAVGGSSIGLDGIVLDGANRALDDGVPALLHLSGVSDLSMTRCEVVGSSRHAVALEKVSGSLTANRITGAREAGLWSVDARGLEIAGNTVSDCGDGGILVHRWEAGEDGTIVARNRVERIEARSGGTGQNGNGINVFRAGGVIVSDNRVADCAFSAIRSNSGSNVQITGNQCLRSGETAIYSEFGFEGALIASNVVDGASVGISVANFNEGGRLAVVSGNIVRNLRHGAPYPDEYGLDFGIGISVEADTTVSGNVIDGAPSVAILMGWGPYLRNVVASGNMIRDAEVGIGVSVVEGAGSVVISGNVISDVRSGAVRGMRWAEFQTGDLALGETRFPHVTVSENSLG